MEYELSVPFSRHVQVIMVGRLVICAVLVFIGIGFFFEEVATFDGFSARSS